MNRQLRQLLLIGNVIEMSILLKIRNMLDNAKIEYQHVSHKPVRTSEQAAEIRGEPLSIGGKALVVKIGDGFRLFALSAALRLNSEAVRKRFNSRRMRFASVSELLDLTGLVPGSVPPFGKPILRLSLCIDPSLLTNERIAFNAGSLTDSLIMQTADYLTVAKGEIFRFAEER